MLCRSLITATTSDEVELEEDTTAVALLIDAIYSGGSSVSAENVEACVELASKFDIESLREAVSRFLTSAPINVDSAFTHFLC